MTRQYKLSINISGDDLAAIVQALNYIQADIYERIGKRGEYRFELANNYCNAIAALEDTPNELATGGAVDFSSRRLFEVWLGVDGERHIPGGFAGQSICGVDLEKNITELSEKLTCKKCTDYVFSGIIPPMDTQLIRK